MSIGFVAAAISAATTDGLLDASTTEPRAFGYHLGDTVSRTVVLHTPRGLALDEASVPQPGRRGTAFELRRVDRRSGARFGLRRDDRLTFQYQVMLSPPQTRTLELPGFTLHFAGALREQDIRIEAWPVTVSPLVPVDVSSRRGLGDLRPDAVPALIDTRSGFIRLAAYGVAALSLLAYLAYIHFGLPWRQRARRPFTHAWNALRRLDTSACDAQWRHAFQLLHMALNTSAGEVLFEPGISRFVTAQPRFAVLHADLAKFFQLSRREHFGNHGTALQPAERSWLIGFCRRCRDAERGAA